jgi:hypothetical protein
MIDLNEWQIVLSAESDLLELPLLVGVIVGDSPNFDELTGN